MIPPPNWQNRRRENRLAFLDAHLVVVKMPEFRDQKTVGADPAAVLMPHFPRFVRSALFQVKTM